MGPPIRSSVHRWRVCVRPNGVSFGLPLAPREFDLRRRREKEKDVSH